MRYWENEREYLLKSAKHICEEGLVSGSSGNFSVCLERERSGGLVMITPSQIPYSVMEPSDLMIVDFQGNIIEGNLSLSSETPMHLAIYKYSEYVNSIIHTHSVYASVLAVAGLELPPIIDELVVTVGGAVAVADYGFPGSDELAGNACKALGDRKAAFLRNHGLIATGKSLAETMQVCQLVERVSKIYILAKSIGIVNILPEDVVALERAMFLDRF